MFACSVQIISRLDSQTTGKFQMFTLIFGRHDGVQRRNTNMAAPNWALRKRTGLKNLEKLLHLSPSIIVSSKVFMEGAQKL